MKRNKLKKLAIGVVAMAPLATSGVVFADAESDIRTGVDFAGGSGGGDLSGVIAGAINLLSVAVGVIAVIMVIIGGLKYIMSSGDSNNINSAKNTILYAIIGLVIVAFAQVIVRFVLDKV